MRREFRHKLKGFTLIEVSMVLVLSSVLLGFAFKGFSYTSKLFTGFKAQNAFIQQFNHIKMAIRHLTKTSIAIKMNEPEKVEFEMDSTIYTLGICPTKVCLVGEGIQDSLKVDGVQMVVEYFKWPSTFKGIEMLGGITIDLEFMNEHYYISDKKEYPSDYLMNVFAQSDENN